MVAFGKSQSDSDSKDEVLTEQRSGTALSLTKKAREDDDYVERRLKKILETESVRDTVSINQTDDELTTSQLGIEEDSAFIRDDENVNIWQDRRVQKILHQEYMKFQEFAQHDLNNTTLGGL